MQTKQFAKQLIRPIVVSHYTFRHAVQKHTTYRPMCKKMNVKDYLPTNGKILVANISSTRQIYIL